MRGRLHALTTAAEEPSEAEIRSQLEKILASDLFVNSERLCRFLRWVVSRALAGQIIQLKEYALGRDVFDRDERYDPRIDSIVRVEARRLRTKLARYYEIEGREDRVVLALRRGSYVPIFTRAQSRPALAVALGGDRGQAAPDPRTVAVLPFSNLSAELDPEFFCEGIAEEILNEIASVPELRVVARASAFRFRQEDSNVREIGRQLGAGTLVEGTVRRAGRRLRVSARIVDTGTGNYIWTGTFDRELGDVFAIQDEIAKAVAGRLLGAPQSSVPTLAPRQASSLDLGAYTAYLQGRHAGSELTVAGWSAAAGHFARAISLCPEYAQAYAGLSEALNWLMYLGGGEPAELAGRSREAARESLRLDPLCAEAHVALGMLTSCFDWAWTEGEAMVRRGQQLQPSSVTSYLQQGFYYAQVGDLLSAVAASAHVLELDPLSVRAHRTLGYYYYFAHDYSAALALLHRALELGPEVRHTHFVLGETLLRLGRVEDAIAAFRESQEDAPNPLRLGGLAEALAAAGRLDEAREIVGQLNALAARAGSAAPAFVYAYAGLQDNERALAWLEKACDARWTGLMFLRLDPRFDRMRAEPRFTAILERMRLP